MVTDVATDNQVTTTQHVLTAFDRCDACGAQAYVRATVNDHDLYFCAHHAAKHKEKLLSLGAIWLDETDRLSVA